MHYVFRPTRIFHCSSFFLVSTYHCLHLLVIFAKFPLFTARKRSLRRLCFYRCLSVHMGGRGVHGCSWRDVVWLLWGGGHVWLLLGGACVVAPGGCAWLLWGACMVALGGMRGCSQGACVVVTRRVCVVGWGACMVAPGGGMCGCSQGGHVWDTMRYGDMINERAVCILLECILVLRMHLHFLHIYHPQTKFGARSYFHRCLSGEGGLPGQRPPPDGKERAVRIPLEYILILQNKETI